MGVAIKCTQYLLFIFNLLFLLAGLALVIIGAVAQVRLSTYATALGNINGVAIFLIIIGCVVVIISFFGCCGAWNKNYCMLVTFGILMAILLLVVIAAIIAAFVLKGKVEGLARTPLQNEIKDYGPSNKEATDVWDGIQKEFHCCGVDKPGDWKNNDNLNRSQSVPDSCCKTPTTNCGLHQIGNFTAINSNGCIAGFEDSMKTNLVAVGGVAAALGLLMLVGIIMAGCLAHHVRKEYNPV